MSAASSSADRRQEAERAAHDELVARSSQGSVFACSWWLDAVAGGRWRTHLVERNGEVVAAWPTVARPSRWGVVHGGAPLTPFLGPLFAPDESRHRRISREIEYLEELLELMGPFAHLDARCNPAFEYWTPLRWHGFTQTTHYTWRLVDLSDLEQVFAALRENVRREVRKARKRGLAVEEASVEEYLPLHRSSAARQDRESEAHANEALLRRIDAAAGERGARTILIARDPEGAAHSAGFYVHDEHFTYYLAGGNAGEHVGSGGASLVMWEAIECAAARGTGFDFEGSMIREVERFVRSFGGVPAPYSIVRSTPSAAFRSQRAAKRVAARALRKFG